MGDLVALPQDQQALSTPPDSESSKRDSETKKKCVLVPGTHVDESGDIVEVSQHQFVREVLSSISAGAINRRGGVPGELVGRGGHQRFEPYSQDRARLMIDREITLLKQNNATSHQSKTALCTKNYAGLILAAAQTNTAVRDLKLLVPYPVYGCKPGWNESGIYFDAVNSLLDLSPVLDQQQIHESFDDLLTDFPFRDDPSRQNVIGLLLTPLLRPLLEGNVPFHLVTSPMERTGKTLLVEAVIGRVLLGRPTPALQFSSSEDEREKRVTSLLMRSDTIIHLDNLREYLDSAALASLLTSSIWQGRLLGANRIVELPNHTVLIGTGNNVQMTSELAKRTVPILLQPTTDSPEERTNFRHPNLHKYVASRRQHLLACLLGMIQLWVAEGRPPGSIRLGGFDTWAETVGGVLEFCGYDQWLKNRREWLRNADRDGSELNLFVDMWFERFEMNPMPAKELLKLADERGLMQNAIRGHDEHQRLLSFSRKVLLASRDRPVGRFLIRHDRTSQGRVWMLQQNGSTEVER